MLQGTDFSILLFYTNAAERESFAGAAQVKV